MRARRATLLAVTALLAQQLSAAFAQDGNPPGVLDCQEPDGVVKQCADAGSDGRPRLRPSYSPRLKFGRDGLASVLLLGTFDGKKHQWFYVRRGGIPVPVESFDNGPDPFNDGLARSRSGGKIGYIDRRLDLVIPARYDGAYPFERGVAVVCTACLLVSDGEHSRYEGGAWGRIDRRGRVASPFRPWDKDKPPGR